MDVLQFNKRNKYVKIRKISNVFNSVKEINRLRKELSSLLSKGIFT